VQTGHAADHSPPSSAAVMEVYSYTSTHPLGHTGPVTGSLFSLINGVNAGQKHQVASWPNKIIIIFKTSATAKTRIVTYTSRKTRETLKL